MLRRIRPLKIGVMRKYEEKVSCCAEIVQHWENLANEPGAGGRVATEKVRLKNLLNSVNKDACLSIGECAEEYTWLQELWLARRRVALTSGNFFQLSWRYGKLKRLFSAWCHYRWVQFKTFGKRLPKQSGRWVDRKKVYVNHVGAVNSAA